MACEAINPQVLWHWPIKYFVFQLQYVQSPQKGRWNVAYICTLECHQWSETRRWPLPSNVRWPQPPNVRRPLAPNLRWPLLSNVSVPYSKSGMVPRSSLLGAGQLGFWEVGKGGTSWRVPSKWKRVQRGARGISKGSKGSKGKCAMYMCNCIVCAKEWLNLKWCRLSCT
jgi:hypothetical protein